MNKIKIFLFLIVYLFYYLIYFIDLIKNNNIYLLIIIV